MIKTDLPGITGDGIQVLGGHSKLPVMDWLDSQFDVSFWYITAESNVLMDMLSRASYDEYTANESEDDVDLPEMSDGSHCNEEEDIRRVSTLYGVLIRTSWRDRSNEVSGGREAQTSKFHEKEFMRVFREIG